MNTSCVGNASRDGEAKALKRHRSTVIQPTASLPDVLDFDRRGTSLELIGLGALSDEEHA